MGEIVINWKGINEIIKSKRLIGKIIVRNKNRIGIIIKEIRREIIREIIGQIVRKSGLELCSIDRILSNKGRT